MPRTVALSFAALLLLFCSSAQAQGWTHAGGDLSGTNTAEGAGGIDAQPDDLPGVTWSVPFPATSFGVSLFEDLDGDGVAEVLQPYQGRVGAFDVLDGSLVWASASLGIDAIAGLADVDGDGQARELVVTGTAMAAGVRIIDLDTGALLWAFSELPLASGVDARELSIVDFDGDGVDELVFAASLINVSALYFADLSTASGAPEVVQTELRGIYTVLNRPVAGDFDGDGTIDEFAFLQGPRIDLKEICDAASAGAVCDGALCVCDREELLTPWGGEFAVPPSPEARDVDGDGDHEIAVVQWHQSAADSFGVIDLSSWFDGSSTPAVEGWYYDSTQVGPDAVRPTAPEEALRDLDGDGDLELVVTVFNAGTGELGLAGEAVDDGLDASGAFSLGIYDAATGDLLTSLDDVYAHGYVDLDGDGLDELVVETTSSWTFTGGFVQGWELDCSAACTLELAWEDAATRITRFPAAYDDTGFPAREVALVDPDGDLQPELLLWQGDSLVLCSADGAGGLTVEATLTLPSDDQLVVGVEELGDTVVVNELGDVTSYSGTLVEMGELVGLPSSERPRWLAAVMGPDETRATPVIGGFVFHSVAEPAATDEADIWLGDEVVLVGDVDGDSYADLFSYEVDATDASVVVKRWEFEMGGTFAERWQWSTAGPTELRPLVPRTLWSFVTGDFSGDGVEDLAMVLHHRADQAIVFLDGDTGEALSVATPSGQDAFYAPLLAADLTDGTTFGAQDGLLDLLRPARLRLWLWEPGEAAPTHELQPESAHTHDLFADLDGDGSVEVVAGRLGQVADPELIALSLTGSFAAFWSLVTDLEPAPNVEQAMTVAEVDAAAGLDVVYGSATGAIDVRAGLDGSRAAGFPIWLSGGEALTSEPETREPVTAVISVDIDGDGYDELVAATAAGLVYGIDVAADEGGAQVGWTFPVGSVASHLAAADVDGDAELELLVTAIDGVARVIDGIGVSLQLLTPGAEDCIAEMDTEVCGTSVNIDSVDLLVQGVMEATGVIPEADGSFCAVVPVPLVEGVITIEAIGYVDDVAAATSQMFVLSSADVDGDGVTVCGGDCDDEDPSRAPGLPELCDGVDNDCDPDTDENADEDGDGSPMCEDCDDEDPDRNPDVQENCDDGVDNDCDGLVDLEDDDCDEMVDDDDSGTVEDDDDAVVDDDDDSASTGGDCDDCDGCSAGAAGPATGLWSLLLLAVAWRRRR